jgi:hypothetical protein
LKEKIHELILHPDEFDQIRKAYKKSQSSGRTSIMDKLKMETPDNGQS